MKSQKDDPTQVTANEYALPFLNISLDGSGASYNCVKNVPDDKGCFAPTTLTTSPTTTYNARCFDDPTPGKVINGLVICVHGGNNANVKECPNPVKTRVTLQQCETFCEAEAACKGFVWTQNHGGICMLSRAKSTARGVVQDSDSYQRSFAFYDRKDGCAGGITMPGTTSTPATVDMSCYAEPKQGRTMPNVSCATAEHSESSVCGCAFR